MNSPKLNEVAVDNTPEPKPPKKPSGCLPHLVAMLCLAVMLQVARAFAGYWEIAVPKVPIWVQIIAIILLSMFFQLILEWVIRRTRFEKDPKTLEVVSMANVYFCMFLYFVYDNLPKTE